MSDNMDGGFYPQFKGIDLVIDKIIEALTERSDIWFEWVREDELKKYSISPNELELPVRKTEHSAGYDFMIPVDYTIPAKSVALVPTGVKAHMPDFLSLHLYVRSSTPLKQNLTMHNSVGLIDADYYNNEKNDGHMFFQIYNNNDFDVTLNKGDFIGQGEFNLFFKIKGDKALGKRNGGLGSTDEQK